LHRRIVGWGFRIVGGLLALPSLAILIFIAVDLSRLSRTPLPKPSPHLPIHTYGLVSLLSDGANGLMAALSIFAFAGVLAAIAMAIVLFFSTLFGTLLYFTGGGIARHAAWARIIGYLVSASLLVLGLLVLNNLSRDGILVVGLIGVISLYVLWVLTWRYA
jgi:hypothetical protein